MTRSYTTSFCYLNRCVDEPSACMLRQMLAPSHIHGARVNLASLSHSANPAKELHALLI